MCVRACFTRKWHNTSTFYSQKNRFHTHTRVNPYYKRGYYHKINFQTTALFEGTPLLYIKGKNTGNTKQRYLTVKRCYICNEKEKTQKKAITALFERQTL